MNDALNIATMPIADKVQRHMMASYYALQAEAKRLGYFFAQADTAAYMPPTLADCLAGTVEYRRRCYLYSNCPESWEQQTTDSYAQEHCRSMLAALAALGIRLQEGPQTVIGAFSLQEIGKGTQTIQRAYEGASEGFCGGFETMCSTSTTDKPAETLPDEGVCCPVGRMKGRGRAGCVWPGLSRPCLLGFSQGLLTPSGAAKSTAPSG